MAKTTITFFLRVKDGKKVKETEFKDLQTLWPRRLERFWPLAPTSSMSDRS